MKCMTCTNDDCCKKNDTNESDDDSREDDTKHDRQRREACQGETALGREMMDTQRISPATRWSEMDAGAWLRALGATPLLQHGSMTAKLTKRGNHMAVKSWDRDTNSEDTARSGEHLEQMGTYRKAWEAAMLRRMLEAAAVDIDAT